MPYFRIEYPDQAPKEVLVGRARFLPDNDATWANVIKRPRPEHLRIFRNFPPVTKEAPGEPIRGTVVAGDDDLWLRQFLDEAVAVVYFLGDTPRPGEPAERFTYYPLDLSPENRSDNFVVFSTKHGQKWESGRSIVLHPPLAVRGHLGEYRIDLTSAESRELLGVIRDNPQHRLIVAVRQYFRTQFSDVFTSTVTEDYATHCSVIEAALNIDTKHMAGERFVDALTDVYGSGGGFEEFFLGLYVARSLYVHGAAAVQATDTKESRAYAFFQGRRAKLTALRMLSRDLVLRALGRREDPFGSESTMSAEGALRKVTLSDALWMELRKVLMKRGAADAIARMDDQKFEVFRERVVAFVSDLTWGCLTRKVQAKDIFGGIATCALVAARLTGSEGPVYESTNELGEAADREDADRVRRWLWDHYEWKNLSARRSNRLVTIQFLARFLAEYFEDGR